VTVASALCLGFIFGVLVGVLVGAAIVHALSELMERPDKH
jgi:hypothetical protein